VADDLDLRPSLGLNAAPLLLMPGTDTLIAAGDFNGDGFADFVAASETTTDTFPVEVHINDGSGGFLVRNSYNLLSKATDLTAADLDGDGDQDVAATSVVTCCQPTGRTWVLWNDGDGNLSRGPLLTSTNAASTPRAVVALDLDGDSDIDLAVANGDISRVSIFYNDGRGDFGQDELFRAGKGVSMIAAADFDRDGDPDLATNSDDPQSLGVALLSNDGQGSFTPSGTLAMNPGPSAILARDLDGDGHIDLTSLAGNVQVHWNKGDGSFDGPEGHEIPGGIMDIEAADLNGDGRPDLIVPSYGMDGVTILFNEGERRFSKAMVPVADRSMASLPVDIDGNGTKDLLVSLGNSPFVAALKNDSEGHFTAARQLDVPLADVFAAEDMNADGRLDLVGVFYGPQVWVALQTEKLSFPDPVHSTWTGRFQMSPIGLQLADLDGDRDMDVVVLSQDGSQGDPGTISVLLNDGDGLLNHSMNREVESSPKNMVAADLDGDGHVDIASSSFGFKPPGDISIFFNRGDAFLERAQHLPNGARPGPLGAGDVNGDGDPDLVFSMQSSLFAFLNGGGRSFSLVRISDSDPGSSLPVLADLDGDDDVDIAMESGGRTLALINRGDLTFEEKVEIDARSSIGNLVPVDLDGDGDLDLVRPDTSVAVFENGGGAKFLPRRSYDGLGFGRWLVAADLDADGDRDLLHGSPATAVFIENTSRPPASQDVDSNDIPDECERPIYRRGDVNGDSEVNLADAIFLLNALFLGGAPHRCAESADEDNDGSIGLSDAVHVLSYLFRGGPIAPAPGPSACGPDPDPRGSFGDLGCDLYTSC
jgi:hypothetical protein